MLCELFDSHCHINEERFDEDHNEVHQRMLEAGVTRYAVVGSDLTSSAACVDYASDHDGAYAVVGCHPHEAKDFREKDCEQYAEWFRNGEAVAIGEIGLDYYYDLSSREVQLDVCRKQMEMAYSIGAPVAYHVRDAHQDMLDLMKSMKNHLTPGIIHCFSGSAEIAREYLKLGYHISFAGPVTFKKAPKLQEAALLVPEDRLLIETDSPYLSPEPVRGRRNEPTNVKFIAQKLAELRGVSYEELAVTTCRNAMKVYGIKE